MQTLTHAASRMSNEKKAQPRHLRQKPYSSWDKAVLVSLSSLGRNGHFAFDSKLIIACNTTVSVQMITSLGGDVKPLALSIGSGHKRTHTAFRKE